MHFAHRRRLIVAVVGSGIALMALIVIGMFGLLRGPAKASPPERPVHEASVSSTAAAGRPQPVLVTPNPELFARSVARALFNWDTRYEGGLSEWAQAPVDVADADEAAAVASDVRGYLPSTEMWEQLRAYGTRQWLQTESVTVPEAWSTALAQAASGQIPRGAAAFMVVGTRHRAGTWDTEAIRTAQKVSFTVFVVCPGRQPCTLLRLSQVDRPLE